MDLIRRARFSENNRWEWEGPIPLSPATSLPPLCLIWLHVAETSGYAARSEGRDGDYVGISMWTRLKFLKWIVFDFIACTSWNILCEIYLLVSLFIKEIVKGPQSLGFEAICEVAIDASLCWLLDVGILIFTKTEPIQEQSAPLSLWLE